MQALLSTAIFSQRLSFFTVCLLENAFLTHFLTSKHMLSIKDKHHFPRKYYGLVIKYMLYIKDKHHFPHKYYGLVIKYTTPNHSNWCMKVARWHAQGCLVVGYTNFFCNQTWQGQSVMFSLNFSHKKNLTATFYGWG